MGRNINEIKHYKYFKDLDKFLIHKHTLYSRHCKIAKELNFEYSTNSINNLHKLLNTQNDLIDYSKIQIKDIEVKVTYYNRDENVVLEEYFWGNVDAPSIILTSKTESNAKLMDYYIFLNQSDLIKIKQYKYDHGKNILKEVSTIHMSDLENDTIDIYTYNSFGAISKLSKYIPLNSGQKLIKVISYKYKYDNDRVIKKSWDNYYEDYSYHPNGMQKTVSLFGKHFWENKSQLMSNYKLIKKLEFDCSGRLVYEENCTKHYGTVNYEYDIYGNVTYAFSVFACESPHFHEEFANDTAEWNYKYTYDENGNWTSKFEDGIIVELRCFIYDKFEYKPFPF